MLIKVRQTPSDIIGKCRVIRNKNKEIVKVYKILEVDNINETIKIEFKNFYRPSVSTGMFKFWNNYILKSSAPLKEQWANRTFISINKFNEII